MSALVFGSAEAAAVLRRDRLVARLIVDNGATMDGECMDHLFDGQAQTALCGAGRGHVEEFCRPYDPQAPAFDDSGLCEECLRLALTDGAP